MKLKSLEDIVQTMKKYRGKPNNEPLSSIEAMLCLGAYFSELNKGEK